MEEANQAAEGATQDSAQTQPAASTSPAQPAHPQFTEGKDAAEAAYEAAQAAKQEQMRQQYAQQVAIANYDMPYPPNMEALRSNPAIEQYRLLMNHLVQNKHATGSGAQYAFKEFINTYYAQVNADRQRAQAAESKQAGEKAAWLDRTLEKTGTTRDNVLYNIRTQFIEPMADKELARRTERLLNDDDFLSFMAATGIGTRTDTLDINIVRSATTSREDLTKFNDNFIQKVLSGEVSASAAANQARELAEAFKRIKKS